MWHARTIFVASYKRYSSLVPPKNLFRLYGPKWLSQEAIPAIPHDRSQCIQYTIGLGENAAEKNLTGVFYALYARSYSHVQRLVPKCKDSSQKYSKIGPKYQLPLTILFSPIIL